MSTSQFNNRGKNICSHGLHPCFTGRCQGMPSGGCGGRKSSGTGSKQYVWDTCQSSKWRGHALVDKTKEAGRVVAISSQLFCSSSLLWEDLSCVLHAEASDAGASWLEVGNDGTYGVSFYLCSSKSACCFTVDAIMFRWVQYGLSDHRANLWGKLKENTCSSENSVWSGILLCSKYFALFTDNKNFVAFLQGKAWKIRFLKELERYSCQGWKNFHGHYGHYVRVSITPVLMSLSPHLTSARLIVPSVVSPSCTTYTSSFPHSDLLSEV